MADNLKYHNSTGNLVYSANDNLVYECDPACCDYTVTIANCPALNGSYDVTFGVPYSAGGVDIDFVEPSTLFIQATGNQNIFITAIGDRGASGEEDCPDAQGWTADDWDGCGGGTPTVSVACTT